MAPHTRMINLARFLCNEQSTCSSVATGLEHRCAATRPPKCRGTPRHEPAEPLSSHQGHQAGSVYGAQACSPLALDLLLGCGSDLPNRELLGHGVDGCAARAWPACFVVLLDSTRTYAQCAVHGEACARLLTCMCWFCFIPQTWNTPALTVLQCCQCTAPRYRLLRCDHSVHTAR